MCSLCTLFRGSRKTTCLLPPSSHHALGISSSSLLTASQHPFLSVALNHQFPPASLPKIAKTCRVEYPLRSPQACRYDGRPSFSYLVSSFSSSGSAFFSTPFHNDSRRPPPPVSTAGRTLGLTPRRTTAAEKSVSRNLAWSQFE